ncbi:hypothetical protein HDU97_009473, partial [Phlyctochytrium planicorne]
MTPQKAPVTISVAPRTEKPSNPELEGNIKVLEEKLRLSEVRFDSLDVERSKQANIYMQAESNHHRSHADSLTRDTASLRHNLHERDLQLESLKKEVGILKRDLADSKTRPEHELEQRRRGETALIKENDRLVEGLELAEREIERLRGVASRQAGEIASLNQTLMHTQGKAKTLTENLSETTSSLSLAQSENSRLASELSQTQTEVERLETELGRALNESHRERARGKEIKDALEEVLDRYQRAVDEAIKVADSEKAVVEALRGCEVDLEDAKSQIASLTEDLKASQAETQEMLAVSSQLEKKILDLQQSEVESKRKVDEGVFKVSELELKLERASIREQHLSDEIEKLKSLMMDTAQKHQKNAEDEIERMRVQYHQDRRGYMDRISELETNLSHMQSEVERSLRAKRTAEAELHNLNKTIPEETERLNRILEDMGNRLRISERERCEAVEAASTIQQKLGKEVQRLELERSELAKTNEEFGRKCRRAFREVEESK